MTALLWVDVETTGLNPTLHDVIQIACIPAIADQQQHEFNEFCQPLNYDAIDQGAINAHGITVEKMKTFQSQSRALEKFISYLKSFNTRFTIAGYNVDFDRKFIGSLFQKHGKNKEYRELFSNNIHDSMVRAKLLKKKKLIASAALGSVAQYLGVELTNAHDAIYDIRATIEVDRKLSELIGEEPIDPESDLELPSFDVPEVPALHLHSEFSVYDSATTADSWLAWAANNNVSAVSFPDHTFASSLYYAVNSIKGKDGKLKYPSVHIVPSVSLWVRQGELLFQLTAWAVTEEGYRNIVKLSSIGWSTPIDLDSKKQAGCVNLDLLNKHRSGVVFGTACENGLVSKLLDTYETVDEITAVFKHVAACVDSLVLELITLDINKTFDREFGLTACKRPKTSPHQNRAKAINSFAWNVLRPLGYSCVVSSIAHFVDSGDKIVQDCKMKNSFTDSRYYWESRHQRSAKEQFAILSTHIEGFSLDNWLECKSVSETIAEASKVISIKHDYHLPQVAIPEEIKLKTDDYNKQLYYLTMAKIKEHGRWNDSKLYVDRFKKELDVIWKNQTMNFLAYFLVYEDIGSFARSKGILQGLARGSAGGCLLSYYLKVTHIDPVANNLPFERFLSHARIRAGSFPDIDSDFGSRGPILQYLREKYKLGFAQIGTFQKMKVKSAIKHAMFALYGRAENDAETKSICDLIPDSPQGLDEQKFIYGYIDSEEVVHKGVIETVPELRMFFDQYPDCEMLVKKLIGLPAHLGRHPSAFVISTLDLSDGRAPTFITEDEDVGMVQTVQFDGPMCERSGLVKADILGVTTIQTISDCIGKIKDRHGVDLLTEDEMGVAEVYRLPEDPAVFKDFYNRKTDSSFQFNTDLIKSMIRDFAPQSVKDLSDITALARPGALDVEAAPGISATKMYILVKSGQREPEYIHPDLESILKETHSTVAFQEQLMSILVEFCDYSLEESDQIRSAIAKKKREVMTKAFERVREATAKRGWTPEQSQSLCDVLTAYSNYSFNRSHSAAYATLGYITMWLKHHYPLEWWSSELNLSNEDKLRKYMGVIGHLVSPPSLKHPSHKWEIVGNKISAPLTSLKGIGPAPVKELAKLAPFESFEELINVAPSKHFHVGTFMSCLKARVMDEFMDPDEPYYSERQRIVDLFFNARGKDPRLLHNNKLRREAKAKEDKNRQYMAEMSETDPFKMFLMEKDVSKVFSKTLLDDDLIKQELTNMLPALSHTNSKAFPLTMNTTPVVGSIAYAEKLLEKNFIGQENYYAIMLFQGSSAHSGTSKKSGRPWSRIEVELSDGVRSIYASQWDKTKALGWQINTPVVVHGQIVTDWRGRPSMSIKSIEKLSSIGRKR